MLKQFNRKVLLCKLILRYDFSKGSNINRLLNVLFKCVDTMNKLYLIEQNTLKFHLNQTGCVI